jgi:PTS system mannitol-specific IIC component
LAGVLVATVVSFVIATLLLKTVKNMEGDDFTKATEKMQELKGTKSAVAQVETSRETRTINKVVFACDAGMGSSAMGASILRKKFKDAGLDITVINTAINEIPSDADIVVTQKTLTDRAMAKLPSAEHISVENFLNSSKYDELVQRLKN